MGDRALVPVPTEDRSSAPPPAGATEAPEARLVRLIPEAGALLGAQIGTVALGLVAIRVTTEVLDPIVYGAVALTLAGLGLAKGLFIAPWLAAQLRLHPEARAKGGVGSLYRTVVGLSAIGVVVAAVGVSVGLELTTPKLGEGWSLGLLIVAVVWLSADGAISGVLNYLNAELRQGRLAVLRVANAFLRPAVAVGVVVTFATSAILFVAGQAMGALLLVIVAGGVGLRKMRERLPPLGVPGDGKSWWGATFRYGAPLVPLAAVQWVIHLGDRYILQFYHGSAEVGLYSAAYGLASQPFLMLSGTVALVLRPRLFRAVEENAPAALAYKRRWLWLLVTFGGLGLLLLILLREWVGRLLLAAEYRTATTLIPIIGAGYLLLVIGQGLENWLLAEKRTQMVLAAGVTSMVLSLGAALWLIPGFGSRGAAWATLLGLGAYAAAMGAAQINLRRRPRR